MMFFDFLEICLRICLLNVNLNFKKFAFLGKNVFEPGKARNSFEYIKLKNIGYLLNKNKR
jgi:hypothetical protein